MVDGGWWMVDGGWWMVDGGGVGLCAGERSITTNTFKLTNSFNK